jgi:hypothetical protein
MYLDIIKQGFQVEEGFRVEAIRFQAQVLLADQDKAVGLACHSTASLTRQKKCHFSSASVRINPSL